ncbi:MAG: RHS repeat-associated core domain-containing protein [Thermoanaerobaculia bacterium]
MPSPIVIPGGGTAGETPLATAPVASPTPVVVSGTLDGITRSATITLEPPPVTLAALAIAPAALVGSNDATGTVTLTDRAPAPGIEIELFSSDAAAAVPATLLVPAGSLGAAFRIATSVVSASTAVTITATHAVTSKSALVTLLPPAGNYVSSLSATPAFIAGGASSTGTVTLALPSSDPGGSDVALTSDDPSVIVPSRVTVKRNTTSASFAIATNVVTVPRAVTLTAGYGGVLQRTTVIVAPENAVTLASFTVTPSRVIGGTPANGTIVLTAPAPFGGAVVTVIAKRRTMITVPASVRIPEGATSAIFPIATGLVHGNKERLAEIDATYNGITRTATLALAPPPAASATRPVARCASLALTPCLMSSALPRDIAATAGIEQSRYNLYTPELTLLAETETTGATAKAVAWEYISFGGQPLAQIEATTGEFHWYFTDHLGTPVVTTDAAAMIDWAAQREPYGLAVSASPVRHQPLSFPGQESDGAHPSYNIFRWYRAARGRYTQSDPLGNATSVNGYSYVDGSPILFYDDLGLFKLDFRKTIFPEVRDRIKSKDECDGNYSCTTFIGAISGCSCPRGCDGQIKMEISAWVQPLMRLPKKRYDPQMNPNERRGHEDQHVADMKRRVSDLLETLESVPYDSAEDCELMCTAIRTADWFLYRLLEFSKQSNCALDGVCI